MVKALVEKRKEHKLTQSELGQLIGVSQRAVAAYEAGERKPSPKIMNRLIKELDMTLAEAWELLYVDDTETSEEG